MTNWLRGFISFLLNDKKGNYLLLGFFALVAHGLLLLNDGVYWDGWLIYVGKFKDRWDLISGIYADRGGLPIYTAFHWVLYQFPYFVFGYKLVAYLFILFSSFFVYRITALLIGSPQIALFIALISLTYPADQANVELIVIPYLLSYFLFWLGCLFLTIAISKQRRAAWWHVGAVVSLLLSFRMYSLLVYCYGFLFLLFLVWWSKKDRKPFIEVVVTYVRAYWIYFLLPILFWLGNYWLFPPSGPYVNSDAFVLDGSIFPLIQAYFANGLVGQILASLTNLINPFIFGIAIAISLIAATQFKTDKATQKWLGSGKAAWVLLLSGAVFFVAGVLPYVVVGRSIGLQGWSTRNAILIAVPVAMMLSGLVWGVIQYIKRIDKKNAVKTAVFIFSVLIILFTVETVEFYLNWQLRAIKDHSVIANVARQSDLLSDASIVYVYDNFRVGGETKYRPHEYFGMFSKAIPESERIGFDVNYYDYVSYFVNQDEVRSDLLEFWYPNLDIHGCQTDMHISAGSAEMDPTIFFRYFYYRYVQPDGLDEFLYTVTDLEFVPIDSDFATNCSR